MMTLNDTHLINRILEGDTAGFTVLVDRYKDMAFTIACRITGSREDAEEIVQDAFVKAFRGLSGFRQQSQFSTWLYRIVYNAAISKKRVKGIPMQRLEDHTASTDMAEEGEDATADRQALLEQAMLRLPEEDRVILTLYYIEESSIDDIHQITGLSKANVKIRLFRARKKLQERIARPEFAVYG
jgi:RNA polymerase sigma-70 factor (ECF subfamily)